MRFSLRGLITDDLAIDLGTAHTYIATRGRGLVVSEPTLVAIDRNDGEVIAVGNEALEMLGRSSEEIEICSPLDDGVVSDFDLTARMLSSYIRKARGSRALFSRRVILGVPSDITSVERHALVQAVQAAGADKVHVADKGYLAAMGAGIITNDERASMVVDLGAATTQMAIVSRSNLIASRSIRKGGADMDLAIIDHIKRYHNLLIGSRTAERVKIELGCALPIHKIPTAALESTKIRGQSLLKAVPEMLTIVPQEIHTAIEPVIREIINAIRRFMEDLSPEVAGDIYDKGLTITGGGALLAKMEERMASELNLKVATVKDPRASVVHGASMLFENPMLLRRLSRQYS
ncbi:MAG: rod shape-determining protein [Acidobacteriota bacterium]|nr:rod shape-determining protein [Blastocatellia bacterium]MDW8411437.1 rod shape-determining protein [Acidobacteriota bacterium]